MIRLRTSARDDSSAFRRASAWASGFQGDVPNPRIMAAPLDDPEDRPDPPRDAKYL